MNTSLTGFRCLSKIFAFLCFGHVSALEGLILCPRLSAVAFPILDDMSKEIKQNIVINGANYTRSTRLLYVI